MEVRKYVIMCDVFCVCVCLPNLVKVMVGVEVITRYGPRGVSVRWCELFDVERTEPKSASDIATCHASVLPDTPPPFR